MLPNQFKRLIDVLRSAVSEIKDAAEKQERAIRDTSKTADENEREVPRAIARAIQGVSYSEGEYESRQRDKEYRQQRVVMMAAVATSIFTFLAFGAAAIYAWIANGQLVKMEATYSQIQLQTPAIQTSATAADIAAKTGHEQWVFSQQQTEYTEKARIRVTADIRYSSRDYPEQYMVLNVENDGREHATDIKGSFSMIQKTVQGKVIEIYPRFSISLPYALIPVQEQSAAPMGNDAHRFSQNWPTHISEDNFKRVWSLKDFIELQYDLTYFNGFKEVNEHGCMRYIGYYNPEWINSYPQASFYPCENFELTLAETRKQGQQAEEYYRKTHPPKP